VNYNKPTLYLIRGVSGAGKSTFANQLKQYNMVHVVLEADKWFEDEGAYNFNPEELHDAHASCVDRAIMYLNSGSSVAVSNTSTREKDVKKYQEIATECGANFVSIIIENRNATKSVHNVPDEVLERQRRQFSVKL
jgi:predicted kinase